MAGRFSISAVFEGKDRMSRVVGKINSRMGKWTRSAARGLDRVDRKMSKIHAGMRRAALATTGLGVAGGFLARSIIKGGAEFEQAITNVGAVMLKTRDEIGDLEAKALELGRTTKFTASQAADAMEIMARAGFNNTEILSGVGGVLDAAAASGLEMAEVADHVSNSLKGMGLASSEATRVADVLALASSRTNSTIGTLGESMSNVASTARQLKIPFEEAVAGVALLQDVGLDASVAGSAMNTMLTKMAKPAAGVAAQMRKFGISFKDAEGNMLPMSKVLEQLAIAGEKSGGTFDKVAFFADLVGLRGQKAAANLSDLFESGKFESLAEELRNAEGAAAKMAAIRMDTLEGDWLLFQSAIDGVKVALFGLEGGPLRKMVQAMTEWVSANQGLIVQKVERWIVDLRRALPPLIDDVKELIGRFVEFVRGLDITVPKIVKTIEIVGKSVLAFLAFSAAVKVARVAIAAYEVAVKIVTASKWLYTTATAAATAATKSETLANLANKASLAGFAGKINGIQSKLGKAGMFGVALGIGVAIGTWIDKSTGFSTKLSGWLADAKGLNETIKSIGDKLGLDSVSDFAQGLLNRQRDREEIGVSDTRGTGITPQVVPPRVTESRSVEESSHKEEMEVTVKAEPGTTATVKKKASRGGRGQPVRVPAFGVP